MTFVDRPLVYIAAPYTRPDPVENTHLAIKVANELIDAGLVTPVVPHISLLWHLVTPRGLEFWYEYDLAILARCDAVYRLPGESTGADREVWFAEGRGLPVFFERDSLDSWARSWVKP
jgi:hypothetical protein